MEGIINEEKVAIVEEVKQEKHHGLIGSYRLQIDGGTVFEYDVESSTIAPCDWEYDEVIELGVTPRKKIIVKPGCIYVESLNKKNAVRRMKKGKYLFHTIGK